MNETNVQREKTISVDTNYTRYQHTSDASTGSTTYGSSINPKMGMDPDSCLSSIANRELLVASTVWTNNLEVVQFEPDISILSNYSPMLEVEFPKAILNAANPFIRDKLKNWNWFHADIEIEIKFNATKFQQGCVFAKWNPRADVLLPIERSLKNHARSITSFTGQVMNLMDSNTINMVLPYCCEYEAFSLTNPSVQGSFGTLQLDVLSALQGPTTDEKIDVNVYAKFTNIKVYTPNNVDPTLNSNEYIEAMQAHSGESRSEEASKKAELGVISAPARAVAAISDAVGLIPIPRIKAFSIGLGWISRRVEEFALAHGLSKPEGINLPMTVANLPAKGMCHVEGLDGGVNLGMIQDNQIEPFQSVVHSLDENSYMYIGQRPWLERRIVWKTTDARNFTIGSVMLSNYGQEKLDGQYCSSAQFLNYHHSLIHTGTKFTIKAVKTFAHSGRLQITILPGPGTRTSSLDDVATTMCYQWDISESSEMSFTVPWMSNKMWEKVEAELFSFNVTVMNELQAATNVSSELDLLIFASYAEDYQLAVVGYTPITGFAFGPTDFVDEKMVAHSGSVADNMSAMQTEEDYGIDTSNLGEIACIGEALQSVRQIIKRNSTFTFINESTGIYGIDSTIHTGLPSTIGILGLRPSLVSSFGRIFRFWSGSLRYKCVMGSGLDLVVNRNSGASGAAEYYQNTGLNPILEFTIPFYSETRKKVVSYEPNNLNATLWIQALGTQDINGKMYKAYQSAGDDFNYHFLVGPPVVQPRFA